MALHRLTYCDGETDREKEQVRDAREAALDGIRRHALAVGGFPADEKPFSIAAFTNEEVVGRLTGKKFWNWMYIEFLWVKEGARRLGCGTSMMIDAEKRAKALGLTGMYLWTESWEAPAFYSRLGYERFAEFADFPLGHKRLGYRKYL